MCCPSALEIKLTRYLHINGFQGHIPLLSQPHKERGRVMKQGVEKGSRLRANQEGAVGNRAGRKRPQHHRSWRSRRFDKESNVALLACLESVKFRWMWCVGLGTVGLWLVACGLIAECCCVSSPCSVVAAPLPAQYTSLQVQNRYVCAWRALRSWSAHIVFVA